MSELEMKTEAEVEDFTDELSDEALDRAEGAICQNLTKCLRIVSFADLVCNR